MILVIRFLGMLNAAIWLGAAVFLAAGALPSVFDAEIKATGIHPFYQGAIAQMVIGRFFHLQIICSILALAHLFTEWIYLGRPMHRFTLGLLTGLLLCGLVGSLWLRPKMKELHLTKYSLGADYKVAPIPMDRRVAADQSFATLHRVTRIMHLVALAGLAIYFWRVIHPPDNLRFVSTAKFRG